MYIICVVCGILLISLSGYVIFSDYIIEKKERKKRKYYYDEKTAMFRKKDEKVFKDDRPLYCASSLLLREQIRKIENDSNNWLTQRASTATGGGSFSFLKLLFKYAYIRLKIEQ